MKFYYALFAVVFAEENRKVPPRHPLQRLRRLVKFGIEWTENAFNTSDFGYSKNIAVRKQRIITRFSNNGARMEKNFNRENPKSGKKCSFYDYANTQSHGGPRDKRDTREDYVCSNDEFFTDIGLCINDNSDRYNRNDHCLGIKQITTGFKKWATRYISACSGQKKHQHIINRMNRWRQDYQAKLSYC